MLLTLTQPRTTLSKHVKKMKMVVKEQVADGAVAVARVGEVADGNVAVARVGEDDAAATAVLISPRRER